VKWDERFNVGTVAEGIVMDIKGAGVVVSFEKYSDVFGYITNYHRKFSSSHFLCNYY
jgi:rRNA biogenesis protein RRP5